MPTHLFNAFQTASQLRFHLPTCLDAYFMPNPFLPTCLLHAYSMPSRLLHASVSTGLPHALPTFCFPTTSFPAYMPTSPTTYEPTRRPHSHMPTYVPTRLPACLPLVLPFSCMPGCFPGYVPTLLSSCLHAYFRSSCIFAYTPTCVPTSRFAFFMYARLFSCLCAYTSFSCLCVCLMPTRLPACLLLVLPYSCLPCYTPFMPMYLTHACLHAYTPTSGLPAYLPTSCLPYAYIMPTVKINSPPLRPSTSALERFSSPLHNKSRIKWTCKIRISNYSRLVERFCTENLRLKKDNFSLQSLPLQQPPYSASTLKVDPGSMPRKRNYRQLKGWTWKYRKHMRNRIRWKYRRVVFRWNPRIRGMQGLWHDLGIGIR